MDSESLTKKYNVPISTPLEMVNLRNAFYQEAHRFLSKICLALIVLIIGLSLFCAFEVNRIPAPKYFATNSLGIPIVNVPVEEKYLSRAAVLEWAIDAGLTVNTYNFRNYRTAFQRARSFFTAKGYSDFLKALKESNNLEGVKQRKFVVYAVQSGEAKILDDSESNPKLRTNGAFTWRVEIPITLYYENATEKIPQSNLLKLRIVRQSTFVSESGLGIYSLVLQPS